MNEKYKDLQKLVKECGMTKPGVAKVLGIDDGKMHRMYYGRDAVLPGVIEALMMIRAAQEHAREIVPHTQVTARSGALS